MTLFLYLHIIFALRLLVNNHPADVTFLRGKKQVQVMKKWQTYVPTPPPFPSIPEYQRFGLKKKYVVTSSNQFYIFRAH